MTNLLHRSAFAAACAALLFAGCSSSPAPAPATTSSAPAGPPALITAKSALGPLYKNALAWSSDVQLLSLAPKDLPGFTNAGGKAAMWEATVGSPKEHQFRVYDYAIASAPPAIHKGVNGDIAQPWSGATRNAMPVDMSLFTVDSDAAVQAASADPAAAAWLAKNPNKPLTSLELGSTYKFQSPTWYVAWGDQKTGGYAALVNATSGQVYKSK